MAPILYNGWFNPLCLTLTDGIMYLLTGMNICLIEVPELNSQVLWICIPSVLILLLFLFFIRLRRKHRELDEEMGLFGKLVPENVEFDMVLKVMNMALWRINPTTRTIVYDNDYRSDAVDKAVLGQGKPLDDIYSLVAPWDRDRVEHLLESMFAGLSSEMHGIYQMREVNADRYHWMETNATVMSRNAEGLPNMVVGTSTCIDLRKEMEKELLVARNRAEESDRIKSAFLANISHEIKTPLNAIVGFSDILPMAETEEEREKMVDIIKENNHKLLRIFDSVVAQSKEDAALAQETVEKSWFDIDPLLHEVLRQYTEVNKNPQIVLEGEISTGALNIYSNKERIRTILEHFMDNALKFTKSGRVVLGSVWREGGVLHIYVRDTGKGIPKDQQDRIFERFVKLDDFVQGMGLGLSVCRSYAVSLGGRVGVSSTENIGSTFWFDLLI